MKRLHVLTVCLLSLFSGCTTGTETPQSVVLAPIVAEPGGWVSLPLILRGIANTDEVAGITPQGIWTSGNSEPPFKRKLKTIWVQNNKNQGYLRPNIRIARVPERPGIYDLTLDFRTVGGRASYARPGRIFVLPFGMYLLVILGVFAVLFTMVYIAKNHRSKALRWSTIAALLGLLPWWFPLMLAGHTLFFAAIVGALWLAQQCEEPQRYIALSSLLGMSFLELYWGTIVSGSYVTAPIISLSVIGLVYISIQRAITKERYAAYLIWIIFLLQSVLLGVVTIYKAFFLDYPTFIAGADIGQVGRLLDSIAHVVRVTHVMTFSLPLVFFAIAAYAYKGTKHQESRTDSTDCQALP